MTKMITISELTHSSQEVLDDINNLLPQLSSKVREISLESLTALVDSESTKIFVAINESNKILGMLSLIVMKIPTGTKSWIEDVVVDEKTRGKGVGQSLMVHAQEQARNLGAKSIDLTSRHAREQANRLYQSLGYVMRETNVYRYPIS